jgi:hypothetical protein
MADNNSNYSQYILPIGLLLGGGLVLQKFGLLPSAESKAQDKALEQLDELAAFKRGYAATIAKGRPARQVLLTAAKALAVAAMLKKAQGIFNLLLKNLKHKASWHKLPKYLYKNTTQTCWSI